VGVGAPTVELVTSGQARGGDDEWIALAAGAALAVLCVLPACSGGGAGDDASVVVGEGEVSGEAMTLAPDARRAAAVEQVRTASSLRFDMKFWVIVAGPGERVHIEPHDPVATGSLQGERYHVAMDFGVLFREMSGRLGPGAGSDLEALRALLGVLEVVEEPGEHRGPLVAEGR
jgi:hypothetical protein